MMWWVVGFLIIVFIALIFIILRISSQVNERLNQMNSTLAEAHKVIGQNLGSTATIFGSVQEKLGRIEEINRSIFEVGKDISSLQELLRAPKFRGQLGETLLENILSQVLPKDHYQMQYRFKSSDAVDAIVKIGEKIVPIDAKFSLENFQKFTSSSDEQEKNSFKRKFLTDVKNRIDEISSKYILPQENTYDFALMYIPAENIYYEIIISTELIEYSLSKKVVPISPNTFYAYLEIICLGLKGFKIEDNARQIMKNLGMLENELRKFSEDFELLGSHLSNASRKYDDSSKRLSKFSDKLNNIQEPS